MPELLSRRQMLVASGALLGTTLIPTAAHAAQITVTHWGAQFYGAPYAVAMAKGYFKANHLDIDGIYTSTGGGTSVRNTLAGGIPYGEVALSAAVQAINSGDDLVIINYAVGTIADELWVTKAGSPYKSIEDLKGQKIGYSRPGSVTNMVLLMALEAKGIKPSEVTLVPTGGGGATLAAVESGGIAAGWCAEPLWSKYKDSGKIQPVFFAKDVMDPNMAQTVGITTRDYAKQHPEVLKGIIAARRQGVEYIYKNPDDAAKITVAAYGSNTDLKLTEAVFHNFVGLHYWSEGKLDFAGMDRLVKGLQLVHKINGPVDWAKMVDQSFLPENLRTKMP